MSEAATSSQSPLAALRRFAKRRPNVERCELCGAELPPEHQHLVEPANRKIACACDACAILFSGGQNNRFRRVPRLIQRLRDFQLTDSQWESLHLPINLAFFFTSTPAARVMAMYPSPAGATESHLTFESWRELALENPILNSLESDVEALLINRVGPNRDYYRVPIDECYKLVGLIRAHWRGLSGGTHVWGEIEHFFDSLRSAHRRRRPPMPDLRFNVQKAEVVPYAATPLLYFTLGITDAHAAGCIYSIALQCQIRIEPARRGYEPREKERLVDLYGEPARWGSTLRPMLWTHAGVIVPTFTGKTSVQSPVPCTYDFNIAAAKYFHALEDGEVPLILLFSGTIFHPDENGHMQIAQIPWEKEAVFRLPVTLWKQMMDLYYPNTAWLGLRKDVFDQLSQFKSRNCLTSWESAIERLLESTAAPEVPL